MNQEQNNAIDRIRDEMAQQKQANSGIELIGEYVSNVLLSYPQEAEHITAGKSLTDCLATMRKHASDHRKSGETCVTVGPSKASEIIDKYYGFTSGGIWAFEGPKLQGPQSVSSVPAAESTAHTETKGAGADAARQPDLYLVQNETPSLETNDEEKSRSIETKPQAFADLDLDDLLSGL